MYRSRNVPWIYTAAGRYRMAAIDRRLDAFIHRKQAELAELLEKREQLRQELASVAFEQLTDVEP